MGMDCQETPALHCAQHFVLFPVVLFRVLSNFWATEENQATIDGEFSRPY